MQPQTTLPQVIPYQGSKRNLAPQILNYFPPHINTLYEPFAGSAAITIAAAATRQAKNFCINDLNEPLMKLWEKILNNPETVYKKYRSLWNEQLDSPKEYYLKVRDEFNRTNDPLLFFYLVLRCVKGSIRYNTNGDFNQSPDNRRKGMKPEMARKQLLQVSYLLRSKTKVRSTDYREILQEVSADDLVYMDPPYQGVCGNRDHRYLEPVKSEDFMEELEDLNRREIRYILSYDGRTGDKTYGTHPPDDLNLTHIELQAGRSSQATLLGRKDETVESLYLSPALATELSTSRSPYSYKNREQLYLQEIW